MLDLADGWRMEVDFSTEWMFLRVYSSGYDADASPPLAQRAWAIAEQHGIDRFVVEVDDATLLNSFLVAQLVLLHKRAHLAGGATRLCGISPENYRVIEQMQLADRFPNYSDREQAVMGFRPRKPR